MRVNCAAEGAYCCLLAAHAYLARSAQMTDVELSFLLLFVPATSMVVNVCYATLDYGGAHVCCSLWCCTTLTIVL